MFQHRQGRNKRRLRPKVAVSCDTQSLYARLARKFDPDSPLSDGRIAEMLSAEGIPVARRTVAKYREAMGIAPSNERRRAGLKQI